VAHQAREQVVSPATAHEPRAGERLGTAVLRVHTFACFGRRWFDMDRSRQQKGFTLLELMITTAIIGVLASVAIPSFRNYQLQSKGVEAKSNLSALSRSQKTYYSEFNSYIDVLAEPFTTLGVGPGAVKRDNAPIGVAFQTIGFETEGAVFYDYDTHTPGDGMPGACLCAPGTCFTATAYGDLDANGLTAVIAYAQPDTAGNICSPGIIGGAPARPNEPLHDITTGRY